MKLEGVEIFQAGLWPGHNAKHISVDDLDDIVSAFDALRLGGRVPLKLTHEGPDEERSAIHGDGSWDASKSLAMGWVTRVWRDGKKLMADFDVPQKVFKLIHEGYLKFVSIEMIPNVQAFNRVLPWVLDAVALLGADQPAVGVLKDLQALTMRARRLAFKSGGKPVTFRRDIQSEDTGMDKAELEALLAKRDQENAAKFTAMEARVKAAEDAAAAANTARLAAEKAAKEAATKAKRAQIDALFEASVKAKEQGGDFIEPKVREQYAKFSRYDKDDAACDTVELKDVEAYIKDNLQKGDPKLRMGRKSGETQTGVEDEDISGLPPDVQVHKLSMKWCRERNISAVDPVNLANGGSAVLRDPKNKELAAKFQRLHIEGGKSA